MAMVALFVRFGKAEYLADISSDQNIIDIDLAILICLMPL